MNWQPEAGAAKGVAIVKSKILGPSLVNKMCDYYGDDLAGLEEEVGARVSYLEAECRLKTQVPDADASKVETIFDHAIDTSRARLAKEYNEFHLVGSTRAVVGAGMEVLYVLFGNKFHTLVAIEVPNEDGKVSEQTKKEIMKIMGKFSKTTPPLVFDSVIGKNNRLHIVFSEAEEAQAALEANNKGPWKSLRPCIQHPREGTMIQVLKIKVKYPLNPKPKRDPLFILLEQLARFNVKVQDIDIKRKREKGTGKAYISMASKAEADAAEKQLRVLASIPNELTPQPDNLTIKKDISFQVTVQPWEFTALRPSLEALAAKYTAVSIQLKGPKPTRNVGVIKLARKGGTGPLSAEEKDNLIKVRSCIEEVLRGRILRLSRDEMQFMRSEKMREEMKKIMEEEDREAGFPHSLHISVENESSKIRLFGTPTVTRNAEAMILGLKAALFEEHPHDLEVSSATRAYLLAGKEDTLPELRDSLQDELDQEVKAKVEKATDTGNRSAIVRVRATQDAAQEAKMFLRDLHKIASSGQTIRVRSCGGPNPSSTCSILRSPIEPQERHIMEPCMHAYEKETAKAQLNHALASRKIPVMCQNPGCNPRKPFGLEDCKLLLSNTEFEKGLRQSLLHYLAQHASQLRRCDSEGCLQVYKAGPALFECSYCLESYCTRCHVKWHEGKTCDQYQEELRANSASAQWLALNTKPCGNCGAPFFKYSGCNHLVCGNCKKDLCNRCGATFDSSLATYRHLREAHGGIYD